MSVPSVKLPSGQSMPVVGLGTWKSKPGEVGDAVRNAIEVGYRHIDCAHVYANEEEVGQAIRDKIADGTVKREHLFITSKLWNTFHEPKDVLPALRLSLKNLGVSKLDLYLIHWPFAYKSGQDLFPRDANGTIITDEMDYLDTWHVMIEALELGLVSNIGVSNFNSEQIGRLIKHSTQKPAVLQVECHPYLNQKELIEYCKKENISFVAYSPLGSPDRPWAKPDDPKLLDDTQIVEMASKYNKSPAQIVLRWNIQRGLVVIPKSVNKNRLVENMSLFDFEMSGEDMEKMNGFNCGGRVLGLEWISTHQFYPFNIPY